MIEIDVSAPVGTARWKLCIELMNDGARRCHPLPMATMRVTDPSYPALRPCGWLAAQERTFPALSRTVRLGKPTLELGDPAVAFGEMTSQLGCAYLERGRNLAEIGDEAAKLVKLASSLYVRSPWHEIVALDHSSPPAP